MLKVLHKGVCVNVENLTQGLVSARAFLVVCERMLRILHQGFFADPNVDPNPTQT